MRAFFVITVVLALMALPVKAEPEKQALPIFGDSTEPPKSFINDQGQPEGIIVDVVRYIAQKSGINLDIRLSPWKRAYTNAAKGNGLIMSLSKTKERERIFDYTDVIYYDDIVLVTHSNRITKFESLEDLKGKTLALNLGSSYGDAFDQADKSGLFDTVRLNNRESWYRMLFRGRVDGVVAAQGKDGFEAVLKQFPDLWKKRNEFHVFQHPIKRDPNYIGIPKSLSDPATLEKLNAAIAEYWREKGIVTN